MTTHTVSLQQALRRLKTYSSDLANQAEAISLEIDLKCGPGGVQAIPNSPSRGHEAELSLRKIRSTLDEVEAAREDIEEILLDPHAPWGP